MGGSAMKHPARGRTAGSYRALPRFRAVVVQALPALIFGFGAPAALFFSASALIDGKVRAAPAAYPEIVEGADIAPALAVHAALSFARDCPAIEPRHECDRALANAMVAHRFIELLSVPPARSEERPAAVSRLVRRWSQTGPGEMMDLD